jgi:hypothetical protein
MSIKSTSAICYIPFKSYENSKNMFWPSDRFIVGHMIFWVIHNTVYKGHHFCYNMNLSGDQKTENFTYR